MQCHLHELKEAIFKISEERRLMSLISSLTLFPEIPSVPSALQHHDVLLCLDVKFRTFDAITKWIDRLVLWTLH